MSLSFPYIIKTVRRSRHIRIAIHRDGRVVVTKPFFLSKAMAENFLNSKAAWIEEKLEKFRAMPVSLTRPHLREDYLKNKEAARRLITGRLEYFNRYYNFKYGRISIRDQRTRWGSCSRTGNLNFSYRLVELSPEAADYIVVHELCHLKEFNHSAKFWALVGQVIPDYKERRRELKGKVV